jgi:hypothetical protein
VCVCVCVCVRVGVGVRVCVNACVFACVRARALAAISADATSSPRSASTPHAGVCAVGLVRDLLQARPNAKALFVPAEITTCAPRRARTLPIP